jgi:hypothetical protein
MNRRTILKGGVSLIAAGGLPAIARAQAPKSIRIGYAVALSGPNAAGGPVLRSQYKLWAKDVNDAGGIMLKRYGAKVPVELIEYDDRSQVEDAMRLGLEDLIQAADDEHVDTTPSHLAHRRRPTVRIIVLDEIDRQVAALDIAQLAQPVLKGDALPTRARRPGNDADMENAGRQLVGIRRGGHSGEPEEE